MDVKKLRKKFTLDIRNDPPRETVKVFFRRLGLIVAIVFATVITMVFIHSLGKREI